MYLDCKNASLTTDQVNEIKNAYSNKFGKTVFSSGQKEGHQIKELGGK